MSGVFYALPAIMGIHFKEHKPFHGRGKMNGNPLLILSDYFAMDILKD